MTELGTLKLVSRGEFRKSKYDKDVMGNPLLTEYFRFKDFAGKDYICYMNDARKNTPGGSKGYDVVINAKVGDEIAGFLDNPMAGTGHNGNNVALSSKIKNLSI